MWTYNKMEKIKWTNFLFHVIATEQCDNSNSFSHQNQFSFWRIHYKKCHSNSWYKLILRNIPLKPEGKIIIQHILLGISRLQEPVPLFECLQQISVNAEASYPESDWWMAYTTNSELTLKCTPRMVHCQRDLLLEEIWKQEPISSPRWT